MSVAEDLSAELPLPGEAASSAPVSVLLIDDDPASAHLCARFLGREKLRSFELVSTDDAADGVARAVAGDFDILLVDYYLPGSSAIEVLDKVHERLGEDAPPAIVLTADGSARAATNAMHAGASDFLAKSAMSPESLSRSIMNAVDKSKLRKTAIARRQKIVEMNERLVRKGEELQRFYQSVSHEVKTPLAAAREFIALTLDGVAGPVNEKQIEFLTYAIDSCDQITAHFNDLLEMTRLDTGKVKLDLEWAAFDAVIARCLASAAAAVEARQLYVQLQKQDELPKMRFDINRIIQVISNLLNNAVKFSPVKGKVVVNVGETADDRHIRVSITDEGCGIHEDELAQVFERLYQAKSMANNKWKRGWASGSASRGKSCCCTVGQSGQRVFSDAEARFSSSFRSKGLRHHSRRSNHENGINGRGRPEGQSRAWYSAEVDGL